MNEQADVEIVYIQCCPCELSDRFMKCMTKKRENQISIGGNIHSNKRIKFIADGTKSEMDNKVVVRLNVNFNFDLYIQVRSKYAIYKFVISEVNNTSDQIYDCIIALLSLS